MLKVLAACGAGIGSSMIIKQKIQKVFNSLGVEAEVTHASMGSAQSELSKYDIVFTLAALVENFRPTDGKPVIIGLRNVMSEREIEEGARDALGLDK